MNLNFSKIFFYCSRFDNHFNPEGLNIIREEKILSWETDSLSSFETKDTLIVDSTLLENKNSKDTVVIDSKTEMIPKVETFNQPKAIKLDFAYKLFKQKIIFIDARSPEEFAEGHIKDAINIPFYGSENYSKTINSLNKNNIIVTYCSGADCDIAELSGEELFEMGFKRVYVFIGGYDEWTKSNYPTNFKK